MIPPTLSPQDHPDVPVIAWPSPPEDAADSEALKTDPKARHFFIAGMRAAVGMQQKDLRVAIVEWARAHEAEG